MKSPVLLAILNSPINIFFSFFSSCHIFLVFNPEREESVTSCRIVFKFFIYVTLRVGKSEDKCHCQTLLKQLTRKRR